MCFAGGFGSDMSGFGPVMSDFQSVLSDFRSVLSDFRTFLSNFSPFMSDFLGFMSDFSLHLFQHFHQSVGYPTEPRIYWCCFILFSSRIQL